MGDAPFDPAPGDPPDRLPAAGSSTASDGDGDGASQEVLDKLEALLGRLRGPDSPAEHPLAHPEIPTLDQPVTWMSPEASPVAVPAGRHIPTLTEPVELRGAREPVGVPETRLGGGQEADTAPLPEPGAAGASPPPEPEREPEPRPLPDREPALHPQPEPEAAAWQSLPQPLPALVPQLPPDPTTRQELRERVESLLDPTLEDRLCERAMADLDRTLIDVERDFRDELAAWRDGQQAQIRDQVRCEIERAVDEVVAALARERGGGFH